MQFVRCGARGAERPGNLDEGGGDRAGPVLADLGRFATLDIGTLPWVEGTPRLGACAGGTGKVMSIGLNDADPAAGGGLEVPPEPIGIPRGSNRTDGQVELGVVIGKPAKYVPEAKAMDHVAGYCAIKDVSERGFPTLPVDPDWLPLTQGADVDAVMTDVRGPQGAAALHDTARLAGKPAVPAGDVFHGVLTRALAQGAALAEGVAPANAVAAIKCTIFGGRRGAPDPTKLYRFVGGDYR